MNKFPTPPPDRRHETKKNYYFTKTGSDFGVNNTDGTSSYSEKEDKQKYNNISMLRLKTIEDMRRNILTYKVLYCE